jgi:electron transport complex protein RnfE
MISYTELNNNAKDQTIKSQIMSDHEATAQAQDLELEAQTPSVLMEEYAPIAKDGLWSNNAILVQMLGLCPLLAVSSTVINALGLGVATTLVLMISNVSVSLIRNIVRPEIRLPVFVMIIASAVTTIELVMHGYFHELYLILGIFIPLIVTNCSIIARAESFAAKNNVFKSFFDGLMMGIGFTLVLVTLGAMREMLGSGTLLSNIQLMFGENSKWLTVVLIEDYEGFLLAILPPGAFMGLAVLLAIKNYIDKKQAKKAKRIKQMANIQVENKTMTSHTI